MSKVSASSAIPMTEGLPPPLLTLLRLLSLEVMCVCRLVNGIPRAFANALRLLRSSLVFVFSSSQAATAADSFSSCHR
jgi:hypothetical protein